MTWPLNSGVSLSNFPSTSQTAPRLGGVTRDLRDRANTDSLEWFFSLVKDYLIKQSKTYPLIQLSNIKFKFLNESDNDCLVWIWLKHSRINQNLYCITTFKIDVEMYVRNFLLLINFRRNYDKKTMYLSPDILQLLSFVWQCRAVCLWHYFAALAPASRSMRPSLGWGTWSATATWASPSGPGTRRASSPAARPGARPPPRHRLIYCWSKHLRQTCFRFWMWAHPYNMRNWIGNNPALMPSR